MTTKNQEPIQDAEYVEVAVTPEKIIHEVEFQLSDTFLEKNPTIKEIYENGKIKIGLLPNIGNEFSDEIVKLIPELSSNDLTLFNPLVEMINTLASYDYIVGTAKPAKPEGMDDKEYDKIVKNWLKEEDTRYKSVSKLIRSFNGDSKRAKDAIKAPIIQRGKMIDALYKTLTSFSEKRKEVLDNNFQPYSLELQAINKAKQDAIDKKNKEQIDQLTQASQEANEKLQVSEKKNNYADLVMEISTYFTEQQEKISQLNTSGLITLKEEVTAKVFDVSSQGPAEQIKLESNISTLRKGAIAVIDQAISNEITQPFLPVTSEPETDVPENAHVGETLYGPGHSNPSNVTQYGYVPTFNSEVTNDSENFANIVMRFNMIIGEIDAMKNFTDPKLEKMNGTFNDQKQLLKANVKKLSDWIVKKQDLYNQLK